MPSILRFQIRTKEVDEGKRVRPVFQPTSEDDDEEAMNSDPEVSHVIVSWNEGWLTFA